MAALNEDSMSRFNLLIRVDVRFALIIVLLASGTQGDEAEDEKTG